MKKVFVCADLHFSHNNIIKYENRPFSDVNEMDEELIKNWNSVVSKDDKVFVLGDVAFTSKSRTKGLVGRLNGHKTLIMGNHDRGRTIQFWRDAGFDFVSPYPIVYKTQSDVLCVLSHEPMPYESFDYFNVYGHVHGDPLYLSHTKWSSCVSIERLNYRPALLDDVVSGNAYDEDTK